MTFPVTNRFSTSILIDWLKPQVQSGARIFAGREPDTGRIITISMQPGSGLIMEGLFDTPGFQVRCRGGENNYQDAENIAMEVDSILLAAPTSFDIGDVRVDFIGRSGGAPQALPFTDPSDRYVFTCNYYAVASTGL